MSHYQPNPASAFTERAPAEMLLELINGANHVLGGRHNWLSPVTTEQDRKHVHLRAAAIGGTTSSAPSWIELEPDGMKRGTF